MSLIRKQVEQDVDEFIGLIERMWKEKYVQEPEESLVAKLSDVLTTHLLEPKVVRDIDQIVKFLKIRHPGDGLTLSELARMIADSGALFKGHFELLSRRHSEYFFKFSKVAGRLDFREQISGQISKAFQGLRIDRVLGPTTGGGYLAYSVAKHLQVSFAYAEVGSDGRPMYLHRGSNISNEDKILVVNDMTTTGESIRKLLEIAEKHKGKVAGIALFAIRGTTGKNAVKEFENLGIKLYALADLLIESKAPSKCKLCGKLPSDYSRDFNR